YILRFGNVAAVPRAGRAPDIADGGDLISCLQKNISHIRHFHTAGVPGRHELDENQELFYPAIMQAIAATDYDGNVGQEFSPRDRADKAKSLEAALRVCDV